MITILRVFDVEIYETWEFFLQSNNSADMRISRRRIRISMRYCWFIMLRSELPFEI